MQQKFVVTIDTKCYRRHKKKTLIDRQQTDTLKFLQKYKVKQFFFVHKTF